VKRNQLKSTIEDLWTTIDKQCNNMNIGVQKCQEKIFSDSLINSKMADLVEKMPKLSNSSSADLHTINMKIIDDIQSSLNEPGISSEELKKRVYEVSKLLPLDHPSNETLDSVKNLLTIQEAEEDKKKNRASGKQLDFSMIKVSNFSEMKILNLSVEKLSSVPSKLELYKATEVLRNIYSEGAIYSSKQV